ncbi:MAG: F0F1 ATP synthase subunit delta [Pseudomonadota bacterium]
MSEPASISTGIAARYAAAVHDLAKEAKSVNVLEGDIAALRDALGASDDLRDLITSPIYSRAAQESAIRAVAEKMGLSGMMSSTLRLMAQKRRLFVVPQMLTAIAAMIAEEKGEVTAEVRSAKALTKAQEGNLAKTLEASVGKKVTINTTVDDSLIGGLVVKVGSKMIDTSIASKLASLQNAMKEVG